MKLLGVGQRGLPEEIVVQKTQSFSLSQKDVARVQNAETVLSVFEDVTGNFDINIVAEDASQFTQENLVGTITSFVMDSASGGHFEDAAGNPVTIGAGGSSPKVRYAAIFYLYGLPFLITKINGSGSGSDEVEFRQLDGEDLLADTYACPVIHATVFGLRGLSLSRFLADYSPDVCTGGTASASSSYSASYPVSNVFDDNESSRFYTANDAFPKWIRYELTSPKSVARYGFMGVNNYQPRDFELQGRVSGGSWVTLDSRSGISAQAGWHWFNVPAAAIGSYDDYQLFVTANNTGTNYVGLYEMQMLEHPELNYNGERVTVTTTKAGYFSILFDAINSASIVDSENGQNAWYSLSFDGDTYKVFDAGAWRSIVSNDDVVHGNAGNNNWHYRDNASAWTEIGSLQAAISEAVQHVNNQMTSADTNSMTAADWSSAGGFDTNATRVDYSVTLYSNSNTETPVIEMAELNVDRTGFVRKSIGEGHDYNVRKSSGSGVQDIYVGKISEGTKDIIIEYL